MKILSERWKMINRQLGNMSMDLVINGSYLDIHRYQHGGTNRLIVLNKNWFVQWMEHYKHVYHVYQSMILKYEEVLRWKINACEWMLRLFRIDRMMFWNIWKTFRISSKNISMVMLMIPYGVWDIYIILNQSIICRLLNYFENIFKISILLVLLYVELWEGNELFVIEF